MQNHPIPSKKDTAYKPAVKLTAHRGWYRVQSGTDPNTYYETSANSCTCPARKPCKHQRYVRALNVAFFVKKEDAPAASPRLATTSGRCVVCGEHDHYLRAGLCVLCAMDTEESAVGAGVDAEIAAAERLLAIKRRAFADTDPQDDSYATLLRQVDTAERAVAALSYSAMRAA